ncbi:hypothetical protein IQ260_24080 [Leptolyngbya cf. ectocarpi LEGE 11479]|uniref:Uncharacterized protein n=1 Tax=Leptolyngbya cf. ectocarpi LEGE 11479 TaxID=1828722 RepID=A0A929FC59_LEPEC|nr:hypothetical protein [Leptolyngbya ectocarpi]MBE9069727.1 hypothetical protein [Leptolyngbya cf. ectocarpi LEGE 11479]
MACNSSPVASSSQSEQSAAQEIEETDKQASQIDESLDPQISISLASAVDESTTTSSNSLLSGDSAIACLNWIDYQRVEPSSLDWPQMPAGFDQGCVFRVGQSMSTPVHILRNDITFADITDSESTVPLYESAPVPWFAGSELNDQFPMLEERGDLLTYYSACVTAGGQETNCEGFPENKPYVIDNNTACFQGQCLNAPETHAIYLLSLWSWDPRIESRPTSFSLKNTFNRNRYRTVPLNQLPSEVSTIGNPTEIATMAFGRTTLGEGEQPTVVTEAEWDEVDGLWIVYLTNEGAADDSIGGERYRLDFASVDGDMSELLWVGRQVYCWRNSEWTGHKLCP